MPALKAALFVLSVESRSLIHPGLFLLPFCLTCRVLLLLLLGEATNITQLQIA